MKSIFAPTSQRGGGVKWCCETSGNYIDFLVLHCYKFLLHEINGIVIID